LDWVVEFDGHHKLNELRPAEDPNIGKLKKPRYVSRVTEAVSKAVESHLKRKQLALTLGGDHSLALGTVMGTLSVYPNACLIWIDAHAVSCKVNYLFFLDNNYGELALIFEIHLKS